MSKKTKYLSYLEEHRKHHSEIEKVAKESVKQAISESHKNEIPVTFMEGEAIVKVGPDGEKSIVGEIKNNRRKVKIGEKTTLS